MSDTVSVRLDAPVAELATLLVGGGDRQPGTTGPAPTPVWRRRMSTVRWQLRLYLVHLVMSPLVNRSLRGWVLRAVGYRVAGATIESGSMIRCRTLTVGAGSTINHRCFLSAGDITIGRNVGVSTGVSFMTGNHLIGTHERRVGADVEGPIVIEDGCWVGANVVLLHGVRIAAGCIIGAGAVVTRDTEPDGIYVGVPARRVRDLD